MLVIPEATEATVVGLFQKEPLESHCSRRTSNPVSFTEASAHLTVAEPLALLAAVTLDGATGGGGATPDVVTDPTFEYAELPTLLYARTR